MRAEEFTTCLLDEIDYYVSKARPYLAFAKAAAANDPSIRDVWFNPNRNQIVIRSECLMPYKIKTAECETSTVLASETPVQPFWCGLVLTRHKSASFWEKVQGAAGWNDSLYPPSPLAAMLATGVLGAGLGYGGASLASHFLPKDWDKSKLRRTGLLLGGAVGAAPGALETLKSLVIGQPVLDGSHMKRKTAMFDTQPLPLSARYSTGPVIDSEAMLRTVWRSPMVSSQLTSKEKSLMTGVLGSSRQIAQSPLITPMDMARLTAGMGVGYASGLVAGKVLSALTGMPPSAQKTLANTGMYAGAIKSVLPMLFGMR